MVLGCIHEVVGLDCVRGCNPYKDLTLLDTIIALSGSKAIGQMFLTYLVLHKPAPRRRMLNPTQQIHCCL